jgi:hypothetical protein
VSLGDTATLVTIAHDWASPVERVRTYPTSVLPLHEDGTEQRLGLSDVPTDVLTYRLTAPTALDAAYLTTLPDYATDTIVRLPRWEDQARVADAVTAGSGVVVSCVTSDPLTDKPTFVVGAQVIFWRSPSSYEVTTLDAVTDESITVDLADDWGAGTVVAPVTAVRLTLPLELTQWVPTSGALTCQVSTSLTDIAGVGTGGTKAAGVAAAIVVSDTGVPGGGRAPIRARVTDAAGNELPGDGIVWTSADTTNAPVYATSDPRVALVGNPNSLIFTSRTITATLGALSDTGTAFL